MFKRSHSVKEPLHAIEHGISRILKTCGFLSDKGETTTVFVVFGASGHLATKKIYPSLWNLYKKNLLPKMFSVVGYSRSALTVNTIRKHASEHIHLSDEEKSVFDEFWKRNFYLEGSYETSHDYKHLDGAIDKATHCGKSNRLFYFALPSSKFEAVARNIHDHCLSDNGWNRFVIEKPFGKDLDSAEHLSTQLTSLYKEEQLFRIDHCLGKEMVQNLLTLRFSNPIFARTWNRDNISSVTITFKEPFGIQGRGGYFDDHGIIRDTLQNHLLQLVALVAMERPLTTSAEDIRNEKIKLLRSVLPIKLEDTVVGQYVGNENGEGEAKVGYTDDSTVANDSRTPTFASCVAKVNNERWDGVPFILKCGKALNERKDEVRIQFRDVVGDLFEDSFSRNELVVRVQPTEAVYLKVAMKSPGMSFDTHETSLDMNYNSTFKDIILPSVYERLILDVFNGNQHHFTSSDELKESWRIVTPLLNRLENEEIVPIPYVYGARGLKEADDLALRYGFHYIQKVAD